MQTFYFTVNDDGICKPDLIGCELASFEAAKALALQRAAQMIGDLDDRVIKEWSMEVCGKQTSMLRLRFDMVEIVGTVLSA